MVAVAPVAPISAIVIVIVTVIVVVTPIAMVVVVVVVVIVVTTVAAIVVVIIVVIVNVITIPILITIRVGVIRSSIVLSPAIVAVIYVCPTVLVLVPYSTIRSIVGFVFVFGPPRCYCVVVSVIRRRFSFSTGAAVFFPTPTATPVSATPGRFGSTGSVRPCTPIVLLVVYTRASGVSVSFRWKDAAKPIRSARTSAWLLLLLRSIGISGGNVLTLFTGACRGSSELLRWLWLSNTGFVV